MAGHACASLRILRMVTLSRWITKEGEHSNPVLRSFIASTRHGLFFFSNWPQKCFFLPINFMFQDVELMFQDVELVLQDVELMFQDVEDKNSLGERTFSSRDKNFSSGGTVFPFSYPVCGSGCAWALRIRGDEVCFPRIRYMCPRRKRPDCLLQKQEYAYRFGRGTNGRD